MYTIPIITINNRDVSIDDVQRGIAKATTKFETSTFNFISEWLTGKDQFQIHTSGSTGAAKPILLSRAQMQHSASLTVTALGLKAQDVSLVCLPTQYIAGQMMLVRSLETGMKITAVEPSSNPLKSSTVDADFTALVPLQLESILASDNESVARLNRMKAIIIGGAPVSDTLQRKLQKVTAPLYATYGMTETISHIALKRLNGERATPYFTALPEIAIRQDDRDCLIISASYLNKEIVTNDIVAIQGENKFQWLGRWDNVINTGGIKVMPEKTEITIGKIFSHFMITQNFFVHGIADERLGSKIILLVEGQEFSNKNDVMKALYQTLPKFEVPKEIVFTSQFVYTETGKINRKKTVKLT